jgi:hypothetical protein
LKKISLFLVLLSVACYSANASNFEGFHFGTIAISANISNVVGLSGLFYLSREILLAPSVSVAQITNGSFSSSGSVNSNSNIFKTTWGLGTYYEFKPAESFYLDIGLTATYSMAYNWYSTGTNTNSWNAGGNFSGILKYMLTPNFGIVANYSGLFAFNYGTNSQTSGLISGYYSAEVFGPTAGSLGMVYCF